MYKGISGQIIGAQILGTDGASISTGTTTVYYTIDGGSQGTGSTATHEGNGFWSYSPGTAECNGDHVAFTFVNNAASAVDVTVQVYTEDKDAATRLVQSARTIAYGTCGTGGTHSTTAVYAVTVDPAITATDQFKGRVILFTKDTTTTNLRGQGAPIDGNTTGTASYFSISTANALTTAPASGDTFVIV